ncbi:MAG: 2'-5' RNA ligase family protein [Gaiellaceae bacterium]
MLDGIESWGDEHLLGRRVPRENLHVTLAFLGPRPAADLDGIRSVLESAAAAAAPIVFAPRRYRETRSVGMLELEDEAGAAEALAGRVHEQLEALGVYRREQRRWLPHVTVLRFREPPRLRPPAPDLGRFSPSGAAVYHSVLRPSGAQYDVLESVALGG